MDVLLKTTIEKLGRIGDVVAVRDGFARNYLLPTGQAVPVNKANLEAIERDRESALADEATRVGDLKEMSEMVAATSITIECKANEEGHLFGSVSAVQVANALREKGLRIEDKMIRLDTPIKEIGVFDVTVHLHADVEAVTKVWVVQSKPE
ncbi:MAG: 50S ribosomal protein L9 [Planctomycetota bacterium]|nr:50S ribosomal protein L9 [Planctomycetota bacterium]